MIEVSSLTKHKGLAGRPTMGEVNLGNTSMAVVPAGACLRTCVPAAACWRVSVCSAAHRIRIEIRLAREWARVTSR